MLNHAGSSHFARHYFGNLGWFIFLQLLRCFSSLSSLLMTYVFSHGYLVRGGFPHSDISGSMLICQLPRAFRRLTRPSSPVIAKASTRCTLSLDPITSNTCFHTCSRLNSKSAFATLSWPHALAHAHPSLIQSNPIYYYKFESCFFCFIKDRYR